jgi:hypothetical protein
MRLPHELAIALLAEATLAATIAGLVIRGRWRYLVSFAVYVPVILTGNVLVTWWTERFWVKSFWVLKESVYGALYLCIALELGWLTFRPFKGAEAALKRLATVALVLLAVLLATAPGRDSQFLEVAGEMLPRVTMVTVWLLALIFVLAHWYRIPWDPFLFGIGVSLGAYLAVFGVLLRLEGIFGWAARPYLNALAPPAYLALTAWWAYLAWRPEPADADGRRRLLHDLQLEASP